MNEKIRKLKSSKTEADRKQALVLIDEYLKSNPTDPEAWYFKASCHDFIGEEKEAEPCYQQAYEIGWRKLPESDQRSLFVGYGSTLRNNLEFEKSENVLREGLLAFPDYAPIKVFLALTLYSLKRDNDAAKNLFAAITEAASTGLDGYENAIKWYVGRLDSFPE